MSGFGPLVGADWLARHLGEPGLAVIDFRWALDGSAGRPQYEAGHIPGAVFVDLDRVTGRQPDAGRHPLPERAAFEAAMREAGLAGGDRVVAYDDNCGYSACRLWFLLRYFGHDAAAVLDGGLAAWRGPLEAGATVPEPGRFRATGPRTQMRLTYEEVAALGPGDAVLVDARLPARYRGELEPIDPVAGHIPGARNAPWNGSLGPDGRFRSPAELRALFGRLGVKRGTAAVAYCGSGVNACHALMAMELAGVEGARLYAGSWSEWCGRRGSPVATGEGA